MSIKYVVVLIPKSPIFSRVVSTAQSLTEFNNVGVCRMQASILYGDFLGMDRMEHQLQHLTNARIDSKR